MSCSWERAETTTTGRVDQLRSWRRMSRPSISGSPRSRITRSGQWEEIMDMASAPLAARIAS